MNKYKKRENRERWGGGLVINAIYTRNERYLINLINNNSALKEI